MVSAKRSGAVTISHRAIGLSAGAPLPRTSDQILGPFYPLSEPAKGGDLTRIALSRVTPVGSMQAWRPAMPVTQWSWVKP